MTASTSKYQDSDHVVSIPALGLDLRVRVPPSQSHGVFSFIETSHRPGFGPPLHSHLETEVFRVLKGRYLFEVDEKRFYADEGDVIVAPARSAHTFVNVSSEMSCLYIMMSPAMDALPFFQGLGELMAEGRPAADKLNEFGRKWNVEFLGPPLSLDSSQ
ncbi:cupin domain-containing protein [Rhizobium sp. WYJ-E13]|uniref:cupin domain-containing protein n=1 Tax=Rhizobium sp. WYJ-E13 TaxID=2849093 RepID=UPI001C1E9BA3|nr:cupin domain-containing protein [Rhizobium sp. WYJ-E13]QWW72279.1 cupin domain-containing protein [Rhizobium sp. WYJ-E13]